jgi:hypothetical protein
VLFDPLGNLMQINTAKATCFNNEAEMFHIKENKDEHEKQFALGSHFCTHLGNDGMPVLAKR